MFKILNRESYHILCEKLLSWYIKYIYIKLNRYSVRCQHTGDRLVGQTWCQRDFFTSSLIWIRHTNTFPFAGTFRGPTSRILSRYNRKILNIELKPSIDHTLRSSLTHFSHLTPPITVDSIEYFCYLQWNIKVLNLGIPN